MATVKQNETQKERIMRTLRVSAEEADAILAADKEIDRGVQQDWDLSPEEHKKAMKYANVTDKRKEPKPEPEDGKKAPTVFNFDTTERKRKANPTKGGIIEALSKFLTENGYEAVEVTNKERQIAFKVGENNFELTLVQKRKPKA